MVLCLEKMQPSVACSELPAVAARDPALLPRLVVLQAWRYSHTVGSVHPCVVVHAVCTVSVVLSHTVLQYPAVSPALYTLLSKRSGTNVLLPSNGRVAQNMLSSRATGCCGSREDAGGDCGASILQSWMLPSTFVDVCCCICCVLINPSVLNNIHTSMTWCIKFAVVVLQHTKCYVTQKSSTICISTHLNTLD